MNKLLFLLTLIFVGCVQNKKALEIEIQHGPDEKVKLGSYCQEISEQGDIFELLSQIKLNTDEILSLVADENPIQYQERISELANQIEADSTTVIALSKQDWAQAIWREKISWRINKSDFKNVIGRHIKNGFEIIDYNIHKVYLMGSERNDLKNDFQLVEINSNLNIDFPHLASALEFCQLQKTLWIIVEVKYRNFNWITTRYFNLHL